MQEEIMTTKCISLSFRSSVFCLRSPASGVTLIEVLLSLALVSAALVTLLGIRNSNLRQADSADAMAKAELLASAKIEELALALKQNDRLPSESGQLGGEDAYRWEARLVKVDVPSAGAMWDICMTVYYPAPEGGGHFEIHRLVSISDEKAGKA